MHGCDSDNSIECEETLEFKGKTFKCGERIVHPSNRHVHRFHHTIRLDSGESEDAPPNFLEITFIWGIFKHLTGSEFVDVMKLLVRLLDSENKCDHITKYEGLELGCMLDKHHNGRHMTIQAGINIIELLKDLNSVAPIVVILHGNRHQWKRDDYILVDFLTNAKKIT